MCILLNRSNLINKERTLSYKDTYKWMAISLIPASIMTIVLLVINKYLPFNLYTKTGSLITIIIDTVIGGIIFIYLSFKLGILKHIFGDQELERIIKKLTFGKLKIKKN